MVRTSIRSIVTGLACFVVLAVLPATAAAQAGSSTFVIVFDRTGTPGTEQVEMLDPLTLQPITVTRDTGAFVNPCTLENVDVTGSSTISTTQTVDKFGNLKVSVSVNSKGTGAGWLPNADGTQLFTGSAYAFSESQQFSFRMPADGDAFSSDFTDKLALKGAKSTDNWIIRANFRIKVTSTGEVQVLLIKTNEGVCKG
jgi:hypothetical protein